MAKPTPKVVAALAVPVAFALLTGCAQDDQAADDTTTTTSPAPDAETISTELQTPDGTTVANVDIEFTGGYATITFETAEPGILTPGFHGFHIHEFGRCEANSVAPGGGEPGDFLSAGGHLHMRDGVDHPAKGDLTPVEVRSDGSARLVATTDTFTIEDLQGPEGSALMLHSSPDNFANIPPRYTVDGAPGPDADTLSTGDAGSRIACGVLAAATTPEPTETTTVTEGPAEVVPPPAGPPPAPEAPPATDEPTETTTEEPTETTTTTETTTSPTTTTETTLPPGEGAGPPPGE